MIVLIAAIGKNRELGKHNDLLWKIPNDLKHFKEKTLGKTIVMGRKTFESLPGLLPNRKHIILSKNTELRIDGVEIATTREEVLSYAKSTEEDVYIIGGAQIYKMFLPYADVMYLTEIEDEKEADVYFPEFDLSKWSKTIVSIKETDENEKKIKYAFTQYQKK